MTTHFFLPPLLRIPLEGLEPSPVYVPPAAPFFGDRRAAIYPPTPGLPIAWPPIQSGANPNRLAQIYLPPMPRVLDSPVEISPEDLVFPTVNPYRRIPPHIVDRIGAERDVHLAGTASQRAEQLFEFDSLVPEWMQSVLRANLDTFHQLPPNKIFVFGALKGVDYSHSTQLDNQTLTLFTRIWILSHSMHHPQRNLLPALIRNAPGWMIDRLVAGYGIPEPIILFLSGAEKKRVILKQDQSMIDSPQFRRNVQRFNQLFDHPNSDLLVALYGTHDSIDMWVEIARQRPHPMEEMILNLDRYTWEQLRQHFGMVIPPIGVELGIYVRQNLPYYSHVVTRGAQFGYRSLPEIIDLGSGARLQYLRQLTDTEIFRIMGVYIPYFDRPGLVQGMADILAHPRFSMPTLRSRDRISNSMTIVGSDTMDASVFMVGFGTASSYRLYELPDLFHAFYRDPDTGRMAFRKPENPDQTFDLPAMDTLIRLLRMFPRTEEITALIQRVAAGQLEMRDSVGSDRRKLEQFQTLPENQQAMVREFLLQVFYTGMYMRRWRGPGHPFPMARHQTQDTADPEARVAQELAIGMALLDRMDPATAAYARSLKICEYNRSGNIEAGSSGFDYIWNAVVNGSYCIRMASTKFIGTSVHYLRLLVNETIPGFDVSELDRIS